MYNLYEIEFLSNTKMFTLKKILAFSYGIEQIPESRFPEVVVAGRSNSGKSSLINCLFREGNPAKVGKVPGKTRSINFYLTNEKFVVVDLPGYGYAVGPEREKRKWKNLVEKYFFSKRNIKLCLILMDVRRELQEEEFILIDALKKIKVSAVIVLTKCDKVGYNKQKFARSRVEKNMDLPVILFSAKKGTGKKQLIKQIRECLSVEN